MSEPNARKIPAVEKLLQALADVPLPRPVVTSIVRREVAALRNSGEPAGEFEEVVADIRKVLDHEGRQRIQPVVNGTGVLIHTNLGRSPLSPAAVDHMTRIASNYNNLEFNLSVGERGKRGGFLETCLALLTEAEAATVVNNCASALVIILRHFVRDGRHEVIISRSQLVEIGGGFRIPDILQESGATLKEIGTTNKTSLADYEKAINEKTALILKVHQSNFFMGGFVETPTTEEISELARAKGIPFAEDLGSGAVVNTEEYAPVEHEPTPAEILRKGVELICFSGDKILGGPQAGVIAGRADLVAGIKKEPFFRAVRCDKLILSLLEETAYQYLSGNRELPLLEMMSASTDTLKERAKSIADALSPVAADVGVGEGESRIGGGTMPRSAIPSVTIDLKPQNMSVTKLARLLRFGNPAVTGFTDEGQLRFDLRTIFPRQDNEFVGVVRSVLA